MSVTFLAAYAALLTVLLAAHVYVDQMPGTMPRWQRAMATVLVLFALMALAGGITVVVRLALWGILP